MDLELTEKDINNEKATIIEAECVKLEEPEGLGFCPHYKEAIIYHNGLAFIIGQGDANIASRQFNQILSTFRFIE